MMNAPDLHCHSAFSIYDGLGLPKLHVARAKELGWGAVCLTEHGHLMSAPTLYKEAIAQGIKPILGIEMYVVPGDYLIRDKSADGKTRHLTVLALSLEGYHNLVKWSSLSMDDKTGYFWRRPRISVEEMINTAPFPLHHNVVLSGCLGGELCQCLVNLNGDALYAGESYIETMKLAFPNFYIEIQDHSHDDFMGEGYENYEGMVATQMQAKSLLLDLAASTNTPIVVTNDSHYPSERQRKAHIAQLAAKAHRRVQESHEGGSTEKTREGYTQQYFQWTAYMQSMEDLADRLPGKWGEQAIDNLHSIVNECNIILEPFDKFSYAIPNSGYSDPLAEISRRCKSRLKNMAALHGESEVYGRFRYELDAMGDFAHYLLLVADGIKMARDNGILTWVRGSAANSLVCYCLKIHDVDPIEYKLMFERFVNPARKKMPDVDIDCQSDKRDLAVKMISDHMTALEGSDNVRAICTYGTLANRAAFRMMAEVEGVSKERVDELAALLPQMIDSGMVSDATAAYELLKDEDPELYDLASQVFDSPSTVSQHACGVAFGTRERPLYLWVPDYRIASSDALVTQYNMKYIEELGLTKQDWLRLDTLTIMRSVLQMIGKDDRYLDEIPLDDAETFAMLHAGKTEGVHSFQGSTQRRGCIEVRPESIHDLVAIQALYRPSGTRTGFTTQFVNRRFNREQWEPSKNPIVASVLSETYGLPIYQEQIMEIGSLMGMTGLEIDDLYKAIKTAKGIGRGAAELFESFKPTYMRYAMEYTDAITAEEDWRLFDAFQGYGFNRGHATSYALFGYRNAFLKCHHLKEFYTAILEAYPDNASFTAAAIADGFKFEPPEINTSSAGFSPGTASKAIRIGLLRVRGVGNGAAGEIVRNQPFSSIDDLRERTDARKVDKTVVDNLKAVGAFISFGIKGDEDDVTSLDLLRFVPRRPLAFNGCKPYIPVKSGGSWKFRGLMRGAERFTDKSFCAKLFWLPPLGFDKLLVRKASAMGSYNAWLLSAVDENGLPFDLIVSDKKEVESKLVYLLARKNSEEGIVITAEGQVTQPFIKDRPTGFRLWGIAGAEDNNPQMWHCTEEVAKFVVMLADEKRSQYRRKNAA